MTIRAGNNDVRLADNYNLEPHTVYYLATGVHTLGTGEYSQIDPAAGDTFIGAPGAIISGQGENRTAFAGGARGVTIEHLTITDFLSLPTQYVVNHTGAPSWAMKYDTVETVRNGGALDMGTDDVVQHDCLTRNAQYGFSAYDTADNVTTVTFSYNEVSYNDGSTTGGGKFTQPGSEYSCGCSGGGKFWMAKNVTFTYNFVHNNGNVGVWVDTDDRGFDISHNYISDNYSEGLIYEISYNAVISDNTFVGNGRSRQEPALYVSESGGDSRVGGDQSGRFSVTGNLFTNNWSGIYLYENSNRYCGDGSDGACTLVTRRTYTITSCKANLSGSKPTQTPDYYDNCRWKTRTVTVTNNLFRFTPASLGSACTTANSCGLNGLYSEYGTTAPWPAWTVPDDISDKQNDHFLDNTYEGPWSFMPFAQGIVVSWTEWRKGIADIDGSGHFFDPQDAGSTRSYG